MENLNVIINSDIGNFSGGNSYGREYKGGEKRERSRIITYLADNVPPAYFTGRKKEFEDICRFLDKGNVFIHIYGMGGIGKTSFLKMLYNKYKDAKEEFYDYVGLINYEKNFDDSLVRCLKFNEFDIGKENVKAAWNELEYIASQGKLLLFIDQVEMSAKEDPGLQRLFSIPCSIILCSRRLSISNKLNKYPLGVLTPEECLSLFKKIYGIIPQDEEVILNDILNNKVKWHTQTIELLAKLAETKGWNVLTLKENLEKQGIELSFSDDGEIVNLKEVFSQIFNLANLSEGEKNALEAISMFPSIVMSRKQWNELVVEDAKETELIWKQSFWNRFLFGRKKKGIRKEVGDDYVKELERKGWLCIAEPATYYIHPIISITILGSKEILEYKHKNLICECMKKLNFENENNIDVWKFLPIAVHVAETVKFENVEIQICFYKKIALCYSINSHHREALEWYKIINRIIQDFPLESLISHRKEIVIRSAEELKGIGEYEKAIEEYTSILAILEINKIDNFEIIVNCNNGIIDSYIMLKKFRKAFQECCKNLRFIYQNQGKDSICACEVLKRIANIYGSVGKYESQLKCYSKVNMIYKQIQEIGWIDVADLKICIGNVYIDIRNFSSAIKFYLEAEKLYEENGCGDSVFIINILQQISNIYSQLQHEKKAEEYIEKAISICERERNTGTELALVYNNAGLIYKSTDKHEKALKYMLKSNQIYEDIFPKWHELFILNYCNLAGAFLSIGQLEKAEEYIKIAEDNLQKRKERGKTEIPLVFYCKGVLLIEKNEREEGLELCKKAYKMLYASYSTKNANTIQILEGCQMQYVRIHPEGIFEEWINN